MQAGNDQVAANQAQTDGTACFASWVCVHFTGDNLADGLVGKAIMPPAKQREEFLVCQDHFIIRAVIYQRGSWDGLKQQSLINLQQIGLLI